ncbi:hypothetical protein MBLNU459_g5287t1 [Dothideomycetes sp. NU459]
MASRSSLKRFVSSSLQQHRCYSAPSDGAIPPAKAKYVPTSGTYPKGFRAGSAHAGVKPSNTRFDDLALVASDQPCAAACVFTKNVFKAAPVQVSKQVIGFRQGKGIKAVVVNSGCANAVTGKGGIEDAIAMAEKTEECFGISQNREMDRVDALQTLVMSTGVIGQRLPIDRITSKIPDLHASLGNTHDHWLRTARAICTTDTFPKLLSRTFTLPSHPGTTYSIAGMTKGAGMIHPNMATLLSMICTDVSVDGAALRPLLQSATATSFNSISIDGDTSTNDTCAILANGAASPDAARYEIKASCDSETKQAKSLEMQTKDYQAFSVVLNDFMADLAKLVVRDGEGATKFVTVRVEGAYDHPTAKRIANSIVRSPLVKTALYGKDANWGRILCAVGYAPNGGSGHDAENNIKPERTSVSFIPSDGSEELKLLVRGEPEQVDEERAKKILEMEDLEILVRLADGAPLPEENQKTDGKATMWTCDFSHEYVTINGDYRT